MSTNGRYFAVGAGVVFEARVRDANRALADATGPAGVILRLRPPAGPVVTPAVNRVSLGLYRSEYVVSLAGLWSWRWESDDPDDADEGVFQVSASRVI